jgi:hypothetical protein
VNTQASLWRAETTRDSHRRSVAIGFAVSKDQTTAQIGMWGALATVSTSLAARCIRVTEPALRDTLGGTIGSHVIGEAREPLALP